MESALLGWCWMLKLGVNFDGMLEMSLLTSDEGNTECGVVVHFAPCLSLSISKSSSSSTHLIEKGVEVYLLNLLI